MQGVKGGMLIGLQAYGILPGISSGHLLYLQAYGKCEQEYA